MIGAAIDRDTVLVWTGERELTRFERGGARTSFTIPFTPLAAQISTHVFAVDERGSTHRFSLAGAHEGFVPLPESPGRIREAALSADGATLVLLVDDVQVFQHGVLQPWSFEHRRYEDWRETGIDLSADGRCVLVYLERGHEPNNLGISTQGFVLVHADGRLLFRHITQRLPPLELAIAADGAWLAMCEHEQFVSLYRTTSMERRLLVAPHGRALAMRFDGHRLGILFDYQLVLVEDDRERRVELPEQFADFVLAGDEAVCVHPELGAWWITVTAG